MEKNIKKAVKKSNRASKSRKQKKAVCLISATNKEGGLKMGRWLLGFITRRTDLPTYLFSGLLTYMSTYLLF